MPAEGDASASRMQRLRARLPWLAAVFSGLLLVAAFPPLDIPECAWIALVPLILACRSVKQQQVWKLGFLAGVSFWLFTMSWLHYVTVAGWIMLCLYCSLFMIPFAVLTGAWLKARDPAKWMYNLGYLVLAPLWWAGSEYLRSSLLTGFPWNTLGTSQSSFVPLLQPASWGGVYAVSAILVLFNAGVATIILRYRGSRMRWGSNAHPEILLPLLALAMVMSMGLRSVREARGVETPVHIGLVQPNIPQIDKWTEDTIPLIFQRLQTLTSDLHQDRDLDLIIWPETALPDDVRNQPDCFELVRRLVEGKTPLLVGSMDTGFAKDGKPVYYNSSFLFDTNATLVQGYDKQHLVLFGEYTPFEDVLPFIRVLTPNQASFTAGTNSTVFTIPEKPEVAFTSLICFEDVLPYLSRKAVLAGARLLVNQTNDAWFEKSGASRQHLAHCVLRCVENGVPAVRAANTGVSCSIDRNGIVRQVLQNDTGNTFIANSMKVWTMVPGREMPLTWYTRHGDLFGKGCLALLVGSLCWLYVGRLVKRS